MAGIRSKRQEAIRQLVRNGSIRIQADLVEQLSEMGFEVTQATISRDIAELALEKAAGGVYVLPEDHRLQSIVQNAVHETRRAGNQVLLMGDPGTAPSVAAALDASQIPGVLGSIAGDDTTLVICADEGHGKRFQENVDQLLGKK